MQDPIIDAYLQDFVNKFGLREYSVAEQFELFVGYYVVSKHYTDQFDPEVISVGGGQGADLGIDSLAILVNEHLVRDSRSVDHLINKLRKLEVEFIFVQTKTSPSFSGADIATFISGVRQFFEKQTPTNANSEIQDLYKAQEHIFGLAHHMDANPICRLYYVTTGEWLNDPSIQARMDQGIGDLRNQRGGLFSKVEFTPLDGAAIRRIYRDLTRKFSRTIEFERHSILPKIAKVEEAYIGIIRCRDYLELLRDDNGDLNKRLFNDNVRDFQGNNPVNSEIKATLEDNEQSDRFSLLNNGVTIVAGSIAKTGTSFTLKDYQIVNGCQTSHILFSNKEKLTENIFMPLKLIVTVDAEVTSQITKGTNSQTVVTPEAFESLEPFHKQLEELYLALGQRRPRPVYYERRSKQYDHLEIGRGHVITMPSQIICFVAMFLDEPHSTNRYYGELLTSYRPRLFQESHRLLPYFVAGVSLAAVERLFSFGQLNRNLKSMKYQLLMVFRLLYGRGELPSIASKRIDGYCDALLKILDDEVRSKDAFQRAGQLIKDTLGALGSTQDPPQRTRSFTNALIDAAAASRESIKATPRFVRGTVKWFSEIKGYGFITSDDKKELFVHVTGLLAGPSSTLLPGQRVRYIVGQTDRGERAIEVDAEQP